MLSLSWNMTGSSELSREPTSLRLWRAEFPGVKMLVHWTVSDQSSSEPDTLAVNQGSK